MCYSGTQTMRIFLWLINQCPNTKITFCVCLYVDVGVWSLGVLNKFWCGSLIPSSNKNVVGISKSAKYQKLAKGENRSDVRDFCLEGCEKDCTVPRDSFTFVLLQKSSCLSSSKILLLKVWNHKVFVLVKSKLSIPVKIQFIVEMWQ